jgi:hypothetical protein
MFNPIRNRGSDCPLHHRFLTDQEQGEFSRDSGMNKEPLFE